MAFAPPQEYLMNAGRGVSYGAGIPADLLHHQPGNAMSRLAYGQPPVGLYAQNQPLPAGQSKAGVSWGGELPPPREPGFWQLPQQESRAGTGSPAEQRGFLLGSLQAPPGAWH